MKISHEIINVSGKQMVYIYITVEDIYEFGKENLGKGENTDFLKNLRQYINNNLYNFKKTAAFIVINGVIVGSLTLAALYPNNKKEVSTNNNKAQIHVYKEELTEKKERNPNKQNDVKREDAKTEEKEESQADSSKIDSSINKNNEKTSGTTKTKNKTLNGVNNSAKKETKKETTNTAKASDKKTYASAATTKSQNSAASNKSTANVATATSGITIKFNNGGVISNIDLEEYVIGVVAAEMPASFHIEALKAQAVVARTYAMKKASQGITLVNSTSHQVYNSTAQMKAKWGSSYTTYYNKIKNAVNATKGQVLKYNGSYIDALYFSISNGKTELPAYVWSKSLPYLQVVSSSWDENISAAKYTTSITYEKLSSKLGVTVNENSEIKILSRTEGDRVNEISIAGKIFTGVKLRTALGLRSADFNITKTSTGVTITTQGFGHGVGMSQYGANGAAKAGYTYRQILSHYYSGVVLVNI